jgi:hypothetical protein
VYAFKRVPWSWVFPIVPALWFLFSPLKHPSGIEYSGTLLMALIYALRDNLGDALIMLGNSVFLLVLIAYSVTNLVTSLKGYNSPRFDVILGSLFIVFAVHELFTSPNLWMIFKFSYIGLTIAGVAFCALFVGSVLIWHNERRIRRLLK